MPQEYASFLSQQQKYPQAPSWIPAPKDHAWALMESWRVNAYEGGFLHEHENHIAKQLAGLLGGRTWSHGATEQCTLQYEGVGRRDAQGGYRAKPHR